jgi:hypothetical protein
MLATVLTSTLGGSKPEAVFLKARQALVADSSALGGLTAAIAALKSAQEACSVDKEADAPLRRVLNQTLSGYERRHELATFVPQPKPKLLKAQKTAQRKLKSMREDMDGDELQSNPAPNTNPAHANPNPNPSPSPDPDQATICRRRRTRRSSRRSRRPSVWRPRPSSSPLRSSVSRRGAP